jgi:hypothetical protein
MRWRRASTILAMLAALLGAPSLVSAAAPNQLTQPSLQPIAGTTETPFVLSVAYRSEAGNPASAVTANVAGRTISMSIVAGTHVDGSWRATTLLPLGSWTVTFNAVAKGNDPQISGGMITVSGPQPTPSGPGGSTPDAASEPASPAQTAAPDPVATAAPSSGGAAPSRGAQPTAPASNASPAPAPGIPGAGTRPSGGNGGAEPSASAAVVVPAPDDSQTPSQRGATGVIDGPSSSDPLNAILLFGFAGVAAVAMIGVGWLLVTGRQRDAESSAADAGSTVDPAIKAIPTVEQRALRRARISRANDPILAALGLPENEALEEPRKASPRRRRAR